MKTILLLLLLISSSVSFQLKAQDWSGNVYKIGKIYPGYYISNSGDTVNGYFYHGDQLQNQRSCRYFLNELDKKPTSTFKPEEIREYKVADKVYRSIHYSGGLFTKPLMFNLVVTDGPIAEYIFYPEDGSGESKMVFHKAHDPLNNLPVELQSMGMQFAKKMSEYVADYEELSQKILNKEKGYGMVRILEIVKEYNDWYLSSK